MLFSSVLECSILTACFYFYVYETCVRYTVYPSTHIPTRIAQSVEKSIYVVTCVCISIMSLLYLVGYMPFGLWKVFQILPIGYCLFDTLIIYGQARLYLTSTFSTILSNILLASASYFLFPSYPMLTSASYLLFNWRWISDYSVSSYFRKWLGWK